MKKPITSPLFLVLALLAACGSQGSGVDTPGADAPDAATLDVAGVDAADVVVADIDTSDIDTSDIDTSDIGASDIGADGTGAVLAVTSTTPVNGATAVALNAPITATFGEALDPLTITATTFTVTQAGAAVPGTASCAGATAIFTPAALLAPSTPYTATITSGARGLSGSGLASVLEWTFTTWTQAAQDVRQVVVPLGSTSSFAILASAAITNIPTSSITGDIGLTPDTGSNISGFSEPMTCPEVIGKVYAVDVTGPACALNDPVLLANAKTDAGIAFINARAAVRGTPQAISGDLNGLTLYPGLYESGTSLEISPGGILYLDAQGDGNAVFILRSATSITTSATSEVVLAGDAKAANIYWTAGSAVTLGTNSIMKGTLIAGTSISLLTGANLEGRALNQGAAAEAVTLDSCTIVVPVP